MKNKILTALALVPLLLFVASGLIRNIESPPLTATYSPIQALINSANEGDTIRIPEGVYYGLVVVNKSLTLIGQRNVVIDSNMSGEQIGIVVRASNVTLENLVIQNVTKQLVITCMNGVCDDAFPQDLDGLRDGCGAGIYAYGVANGVEHARGSLTLTNLTITGCFVGIQLYSFESAQIVNVVSKKNLFGIITERTSSLNLLGCTIADGIIGYSSPLCRETSSGGGSGIWVGRRSHVVMRNCTIENYSFGLSFLPETTYNKVQYNNFLNNTHNTDVNLEALWVGEFLNNYWSDYHGVDANADGLGDTAYIINQYNADPHPMMADPPYTPPPKYEYQAGGGCPGKVPNPK